MIIINTSTLKKCKKHTTETNLILLAKFFVPLGVTYLLISITHSLFNSALARLPSPEIYLSAFAISKSFMNIIQTPTSMVKQLITSLIDDSKSFYKLKRFVIILITCVVSFFAILIYSGGAKWILKNIMGVKGKILNETITILKIFIIFPVFVTLRNFMQSIAIKLRRTPLVTLASLIRVIFVFIIVLSVKKLSFIPSAVLAGLMFLSAIIVESISIYIGIKIPVKNIPKKLDMLKLNSFNHETKEITNRVILSFFAPLILTSFINSLARPIIDSGLARTYSPEIALSTYAVAWGIGIIVLNPITMFHQVPLNFINNKNDKKVVKKFAFYTAIILSIIMVIISFTPTAQFILLNIIGVTDEICNLSISVLKVMSVLPIIMITRQYFWGIFMKNHITKPISIGKTINVISLLATIFCVSLLNLKNPALIGILGKISGEFFETVYLWHVSSKLSHRQTVA